MSKTQEERCQRWRQLVAQQEQSGVSVQVFCQQHRTSPHSFYKWRRRLAAQVPIKFALVETDRGEPSKAEAMELTLITGERLRIAPGTDAATLRVVLGVLRERR
jgi:transposase-like protein